MDDTKIALNDSGISTSDKVAMWFMDIKSIALDFDQGKYRFRAFDRFKRDLEGRFSSFSDRNDWVMKILHVMKYDNIQSVVSELSRMHVNSRFRGELDPQPFSQPPPLRTTVDRYSGREMQPKNPIPFEPFSEKPPFAEWREKLVRKRLGTYKRVARHRRSSAVEKLLGEDLSNKQLLAQTHLDMDMIQDKLLGLKFSTTSNRKRSIFNESDPRQRDERFDQFKRPRRSQDGAGAESSMHSLRRSDRFDISGQEFSSWRSALSSMRSGHRVDRLDLDLRKDTVDSHPRKDAIDSNPERDAVFSNSIRKEVDSNPKFTAKTNDHGQIVLNIFLEDRDLHNLISKQGQS